MNATAQQLDIPTLERMAAANPADGGVWSTLGVFLRREGKTTAAAACHRRGVERSPTFAAIWSNLGNSLVDLGRFSEAVPAHRRACALTPEAHSAHFNLAIALRKSGRFEEALKALERGLAIKPGDAATRWEMSLILLQLGDYARGLEEYEVRRGIPAYRNRTAPGPQWDGRRLDGETLLLTTEQGFGDALLALRYVQPAAARGGRIILETHAEQRRIIAGLPADELLPAGAPYPEYRYQASLMSLPHILGSTFDTLPPPVRITVPEDSRRKAAALIGPPDGSLKVGVVWSGRITFAENQLRATTLGRFLQFAEIPGVRLFSLQKGPPEAQLEEYGASALLTPLGPHFNDFADTAACLELLDLVVMTDSSVAHLAGSLGRPIWNLVQHVPYWIYGYEGDRTPWYPSMRLFRQGADHDWAPVFARVAEKLREEAARKRADFAAGRS
jgi:Flp pilus assembly protein TadD